MNLRFSTMMVTALLASCVSPPEASSSKSQPQPTTKPVVAVAAPAAPVARPAGDWIDWPITPGDWVYRQDDRGSIALFGTKGQDALVTLRCDRMRKRVYLARANDVQQGNHQFVLRTSSVMRQLAGVPTGGTPPYDATEILPSDTILDAITYTRGRIALESSGQTTLVIPSWSEIARVVEDCRI
jgi:hypothetical protein